MEDKITNINDKKHGNKISKIYDRYVRDKKFDYIISILYNTPHTFIFISIPTFFPLPSSQTLNKLISQQNNQIVIQSCTGGNPLKIHVLVDFIY